ncbi:hypothetical protein KOW79_015492 [Hemibagrus wyckioides]|uniref:Uncharacterized protein n=1 Tax=Hemibagrus wyckioides TaxID=337641 RepID=A0A9D3NHV5_9TELE|nr:hypothetical protein KOW79_015492 [Hemibagrus wyckioides]
MQTEKEMAETGLSKEEGLMSEYHCGLHHGLHHGPQLAWAALREDQVMEQGPAPLPMLHLTGPFITQTPVTVTDGSGPGLAPHQRQNHTAHKPTDSWSAVSSGG